MRVVAVDPGETTGYVVYDTITDKIIVSGEVFGNFRGCVDYILALGDFFILEDFRVRPGAARGLSKHKYLWPVEWLGAFRYLAPDLFITQTAAQAKAMRVEGYDSPHEADALRHLKVWLSRNVDTREVLKEALKALL